jgi:hypothetical protein
MAAPGLLISLGITLFARGAAADRSGNSIIGAIFVMALTAMTTVGFVLATAFSRMWLAQRLSRIVALSASMGAVAFVLVLVCVFALPVAAKLSREHPALAGSATCICCGAILGSAAMGVARLFRGAGAAV